MSVIRGVLECFEVDLQPVCNFLKEKNVSWTTFTDRVLPFEDSSGAFAYLGSGSHVGNVALTL